MLTMLLVNTNFNVDDTAAGIHLMLMVISVDFCFDIEDVVC